MAKGSHKTWGGWETRTCWHCGARVVLARGAAIHSHPTGGEPFTLCEEHLEYYADAYRASVDPDLVMADTEEVDA